MSASLQFNPTPYDPQLLTKWKNGDYSFLTDSNASDYIKRELTSRAHIRLMGRRHRGHHEGDRRFFGEAVVAVSRHHKAGWYASFKWLTGECWQSDEEKGASDFRAGFDPGPAGSMAVHRTRAPLHRGKDGPGFAQ